MAEEDLQNKIAQARQIMGGNKTNETPRLFAKELAKKRQSLLSLSAKDSMQTSGDATEEDLIRRREEARRAMESAEYRKNREEREQARIQAEIMKKKIEETRKARMDLKRKQSLNEAIKKKEESQKEGEKEKDYQDRLAQAKKVIASITQTEKPDIKTYRTLKTDIGEETKEGGLTMAKIALEEEARRRLETLPKEPKSKIGKWLILASLLLFVGGAGVIVFSLSLTNVRPTSVNPVTINSLVTANENKEISLNGKSPSELRLFLKSQIETSYPVGHIVNIYPTKEIEGEGKFIANRENFFSAWTIDLPVNFVHFLTNSFMLGVVSTSADTGNKPFLILKTRSFENTFDSMIREENDLVKNLLSSLIDPEISRSVSFINNDFRDEIISNTDARVLEDEEGNILVVYGFFDDETLVITTDTEAFETLLAAY